MQYKKMMRLLKISKTAAVMCTVIGVLFLALLAIGLLVAVFLYPFERPAAYALGLLLGCLLSAVKVVLLERALDRSMDMEGAPAKGYASLMAVLRYLLTIFALLPVFFFRDVFGLSGVIIGILSLQAAAYITGHIMKPEQDLK